MPLRIVSDTNFWISVAGWQGAARRLYRALHVQEYHFLTSTEILAEVGRILKILPEFTDQKAYEWYCELGEHCEILPPRKSILDRITVCRDPDDNKFIECAVWGHADMLISRDKDLLTLNGYEGIRIVSPEQLWMIIDP